MRPHIRVRDVSFVFYRTLLLSSCFLLFSERLQTMSVIYFHDIFFVRNLLLKSLTYRLIKIAFIRLS